MPLIDLDQANAFETAALPGSGDTDAGAGGLTTSSMTNETDLEAYGLDTYSQSQGGGRGGDSGDGGGVSADYNPPDGSMHVAPHLAGTAVDHPFWTFAILLVGLGIYKAVTKNESSENIKVSLPTAFAVTAMATAGILAEKWVFAMWQVPSITPTMDYL